MSTLQQIRQGLGEAWESLRDGWMKLYRRAAGAITRFTPGDRADDSEQLNEINLRSAGWGVLAAEVFDGENEVLVRLEAPGMEKSDFNLEVVDDVLVISGEKHLDRQRSEGSYQVTERAYGYFERAIPLPAEVETNKATASYTSGVLRVELPKAGNDRRRARQVPVV